MRPIDFANLNPGDILIADTFDSEIMFFDLYYQYRYRLFVVESCNKVDNAFIVSVGDRGYRYVVTKHDDEYVITNMLVGSPVPVANGAIYHYTAEEAEATNLYERAEAQEDLRDFVCRSGGRNAPKSLEEAFDNLYAQHVPNNDHALTSVANNETARGIMGEVVRGGINIARDLLEEDLKKIDELIQEAKEARNKINQLATENTVTLQLNSEVAIFTNPTVQRPFDNLFITGTAITEDGAEYLVSRMDESRAYPAVSIEDIEARKELTEQVKTIFTAFWKPLKKAKKEMNYPVDTWGHHMRQIDNGWDERGNNTIANILSLATYRVSQLKTARRELIKQANGYITQLEEYYELAHGE